MASKIWLDGKLVDKEDAKISVYDHGLLYGDGVFEGIRIYHGKVFELDAHLRRLFASAKAIRLAIPLNFAQFKSALEQTVKANGLADGYIRAIVTRGIGALGIDPAKCANPSVIIIVDGIQVYPKEMYERGIAVITASIIRNHPNALSPRVKSLNYLNNILARIEANDAGVQEAVMLNHEGNVAECTVENIFIVRDGRVQTPPSSDGALEGITREVMIGLCRRLGIEIMEKTLQRQDLYVADEFFITGTGAEVVPVTKIDGRPVGAGEVGPITQRLIDAFHRHARES